MVSEEPGWVVVALEGHFSEENKGPGDRNVVGRLPFVPDPFERFLGVLRHGAHQQAVLWGFFRVGVTDFA